MKFGSLCAMGGFAPFPVMSALRGFPEDFHKPSPNKFLADAAE
ncbi:NADH-ubiquinone oxidoreductase-F iron-sulfur binding region domain-containing protein [Methylocystis parvus]